MVILTDMFKDHQFSNLIVPWITLHTVSHLTWLRITVRVCACVYPSVCVCLRSKYDSVSNSFTPDIYTILRRSVTHDLFTQ